MEDEKEYEYGYGQESNLSARLSVLKIGSEQIKGIALVNTEISSYNGEVSYSWSFHEWEYACEDTNDGGESYYVRHQYDANPIVEFRGFSDYQELMTDMDLKLIDYE